MLYTYIYFVSEQIWTADTAQASTTGENNLIFVYPQVMFPVFISLPKHIAYTLFVLKVYFYHSFILFLDENLEIFPFGSR